MAQVTGESSSSKHAMQDSPPLIANPVSRYGIPQPKGHLGVEVVPEVYGGTIQSRNEDCLRSGDTEIGRSKHVSHPVTPLSVEDKTPSEDRVMDQVDDGNMDNGLILLEQKRKRIEMEDPGSRPTLRT
nr:hypothetical protein Iba_chr02eCG9560 [Ipomoea batatas]